MKRRKSKFVRRFFIVLVFLIAIAGATYAIVTHHIAPINENYVKQLVAKRTNLGASPTAIHKLDDATIAIQPYLSTEQAQAGDWLLVYKDAQKAVLFRPSSRKIISLINTTRSDGLDIPFDTKITIFFPEQAKDSAKQVKQNILTIWPELSGKVSIHATHLDLPYSFITTPNINDASNDLQTVTTITEKVPLSIFYDEVPSELVQDDVANVIIYLHE